MPVVVLSKFQYHRVKKAPDSVLFFTRTFLNELYQITTKKLFTNLLHGPQMLYLSFHFPSNTFCRPPKSHFNKIFALLQMFFTTAVSLTELSADL